MIIKNLNEFTVTSAVWLSWLMTEKQNHKIYWSLLKHKLIVQFLNIHQDESFFLVYWCWWLWWKCSTSNAFIGAPKEKIEEFLREVFSAQMDDLPGNSCEYCDEHYTSLLRRHTALLHQYVCAPHEQERGEVPLIAHRQTITNTREPRVSNKISC